MQRSDAFPSKYLSKSDLADGPLLAVIDEVSLEHLSGMADEDFKPVIAFTGDVKPLVCNVVNWSTIEDAYGGESGDWRGQTIEIYHDPAVAFGGRRVGGLRVRIPDGPAKAAAGAPKPAKADPPQGDSRAMTRVMRTFNSQYLELDPAATREDVREGWLKMLAASIDDMGVASPTEFTIENWAKLEAGIAAWLEIPF